MRDPNLSVEEKQQKIDSTSSYKDNALYVMKTTLHNKLVLSIKMSDILHF